MAYLMLVILVLEFMATALNQVGYSEVATALWKWYSGFAKNDRLYKKDQLRAAIVQLRQDISQVSSVDEFAKWAKMRRRLDALTEAYDQISKQA
ncbi:GET complex subunit get1 [Spiromyces aspiralis]|uniref:GET complex subunit get1 n=1 Tax=Spiromyces aspiralis TaxID=68401 RepID=A0ACC1HF53_9FUNG|nr:GET complex subunit get1 [Spiromyces aspiralis]